MTSSAVAPSARRQNRGATAPRRAQLRVVAEPVPRRLAPAVAFVLAVTVVFGALLAAAVVHSMLVTGQAHLDTVTARTRVEREQLDRERLRLATLESPARITREAERIGMVPGGEDNWLSSTPGPGPTAATPGSPSAPDPGPSDATPAGPAEVAAAAPVAGAPTP